VHYNSTTTTAASLSQNPKITKLVAFFTLCQQDTFARTIVYHQVPEFYTWNHSTHCWARRRKGGDRLTQQDGSVIIHSDTIGRLHMISPRQGELYFLRVLLVNVIGPTSFTNLRTNTTGQVLSTFKECCSDLGLLDDDRHLESAMTEIADCRPAARLREFFVTAVICCEPSHPEVLLGNFMDDLCGDFVMERRSFHADFTLGNYLLFIPTTFVF
jgi:hypothetical protein